MNLKSNLTFKQMLKKVSKKLKDKKVKDLIPGGIDKGSPDSDFDPKQLEKGIEIEMEHTDDPEIAKEVAKDHLSEVQNYYLTDKGESRLDILEEDADKEYEEQIAGKKAVRHPSFVMEVIELIDELKDKDNKNQEIVKIVLDTYGNKMEIKDILKEQGIL